MSPDADIRALNARIAPAKKIMVTAHNNVDHMVQTKDKCDAFMVKPLRKATLLYKIK